VDVPLLQFSWHYVKSNTAFDEQNTSPSVEDVVAAGMWPRLVEMSVFPRSCPWIVLFLRFGSFVNCGLQPERQKWRGTIFGLQVAVLVCDDGCV
jgi:hypothetical protein